MWSNLYAGRPIPEKYASYLECDFVQCGPKRRCSLSYCAEVIEYPGPAPVGGGTCSNGVVGVKGFDQSCALECGTCGGKDYNDKALSAGLSESHCCVGRISDSGVNCDVSGAAPCAIVAGEVR